MSWWAALAFHFQSAGQLPYALWIWLAFFVSDIVDRLAKWTVERLKRLGATEIERVKTWVVMRDPVGTIFCVVRVQVRDMFEQHATTWD